MKTSTILVIVVIVIIVIILIARIRCVRPCSRPSSPRASPPRQRKAHLEKRFYTKRPKSNILVAKACESDSSSSCPDDCDLGCQGCDTKCKGASLTTNFVKNNAIFQNELGNPFTPPDTIMAIGPTVAIAMVNTLIGYYQRPSMTRVNLETTGTLFSMFPEGRGSFDVQVIYDEFNSRFFALTWQPITLTAALTVTSPSSVAGTYDARKMVNSTFASFPVTNQIVPTDPIDCFIDPLTWGVTPACAAALVGKIALVKRRFITLPPGLGNNAVGAATAVRNAGAIGMILYDDEVRPIGNFGGLNVSPSFPQIAVTLQTGQLLAAAYGSYPPFAPVSPLNGTMSALSTPIIKNYMHIAVSKTSAPLSTNDWFKYQFTTNYWLTFNGNADYPKIAVDKDKFYISTVDLPLGSLGNFIGADATVTVLKKNDLVNNTAPTFINEFSSTFISQNSHLDHWIAQPSRIVYSGYKSYLPQFFVTYANYGFLSRFNRITTDATGLRVFVGPSMTNYIDVPFPVPTFIDPGVGAQQPLSSTLAPSAPLETQQFLIQTPVIYKNSLWVATGVLSGTKAIIRWYELDVKKAVSHGSITIKQWGDIDTGVANESCIQPAINVDKCGNMGIVFTISGPNTLPTFAYTGRLKKDPLGTVRNPYQIIKASPYPYNGGNQGREFSTGTIIINRWEDYVGLVIDPNDHKTFFAFGEVSCDDQAPALLTDVDANRRALKWTTVMSSFNIEKSCGTETYPGVRTLTSSQNNMAARAPAQYDQVQYDDEQGVERSGGFGVMVPVEL